jgi:hypothetical protein
MMTWDESLVAWFTSIDRAKSRSITHIGGEGGSVSSLKHAGPTAWGLNYSSPSRDFSRQGFRGWRLPVIENSARLASMMLTASLLLTASFSMLMPAAWRCGVCIFRLPCPWPAIYRARAAVGCWKEKRNRQDPPGRASCGQFVGLISLTPKFLFDSFHVSCFPLISNPFLICLFTNHAARCKLFSFLPIMGLFLTMFSP